MLVSVRMMRTATASLCVFLLGSRPTLEGALEHSTGDEQALGPAPMRRLAKKWGGAPVRAAVLLRRPDYLKWGLRILGFPIIPSRVWLGPELRVVGGVDTRKLPDRQLLVMDQLGTLHLIGLRGLDRRAPRGRADAMACAGCDRRGQAGEGKIPRGGDQQR